MPSVCHLHQNGGGGGGEMSFGPEAAGHNFVHSQPQRDYSKTPTKPSFLSLQNIPTSSSGKGPRCGGRIQQSSAAQHRRLPAPPPTSWPGARWVPAHQQQRSQQLLARLLPGPRIPTIQQPLLPAQPSLSPRMWTWHETYASTLQETPVALEPRIVPEPSSKASTGSTSLSRQPFCCGSRDWEKWDPVTGSRSLLLASNTLTFLFRCQSPHKTEFLTLNRAM